MRGESERFLHLVMFAHGFGFPFADTASHELGTVGFPDVAPLDEKVEHAHVPPVVIHLKLAALEPTEEAGADVPAPNRRQVKPAPPEASKRREVLGRSERPAMERPAACIIASPIRRTACVNDKRPQKPCASTTV